VLFVVLPVSVDDDTVEVVSLPPAVVVLDELDFELEPQPASANTAISAPPKNIRVEFRNTLIAAVSVCRRLNRPHLMVGVARDPDAWQDAPVADDDAELTLAWQQFCARLGALGERVAAPPFPGSGADHAAAVHHLARQVVLALHGELEFGDPSRPAFHRYEEPWAQWGGPNPDNVYTRAAIDPAGRYRVPGDVTGVRAAIFSVVEGDMHLDRYGVFGERTLADLDVGAGGSFECWISPERHDGNWIESHADARLFLVRQYQCDWERDRIARFAIERVDAHVPAPVSLVDALARAATWTERSIGYWCAYVEKARATMPRNAVGPPGTPRGGAPNIAYGGGWWDLAPDEALVVTSERPDADYWGWTIHHRYRLDSGDFASHQTSLNMAQTFVDDDGQVRLALAATDPGVANWIDTEGRPEGMLMYRSVGTRTRPASHAEVVKLADVRAHVPASHPVVDAETRRAQLGRRRAAALGRYC
jgi:hypothetical protein